MAKYCTKCGNQLNDEDMFCGKCGKAFVNSNMPTPTSNTYENRSGGGEFFVRVILPFFIALGFAIGGFVAEEGIMVIIAVIPLLIMFSGIKAARRRCPKCGAWHSMKTIQSDCVGQQKVKVRRELGSGYFRTSGTHTFGVRQVFVSADEYVYNEIYKCEICGHEIKGTRRRIDDGIR